MREMTPHLREAYARSVHATVTRVPDEMVEARLGDFTVTLLREFSRRDVLWVLEGVMEMTRRGKS